VIDMFEIERLVKAALHRDTLVDIVATFGTELRLLSPGAKAKIRKDVFLSRPPTENMDINWKETWMVIQ
jgi:hypothetical protein